MISYRNILLSAALLCISFQPVYGIYRETINDPSETGTLIVKVKKESNNISTLHKSNGIITQTPLFSTNSTLPHAKDYYILTTNNKLPLKLIIKSYTDSRLVDWIVPDTYIYPQSLKNGGFDLETISPTSKPSPTIPLSPTAFPTRIPTRKPSITPTNVLTKVPTKIPTQAPTITPSPIIKKNLGIAVLDSGIVPSAVDSSIVITHSSSPIIDELGHGTYITETIQTRVPQQSQIIPFKVIDKEGYGKLSDVLQTLDYIHTHKELNIQLINMSFASERIVLGTDICNAYEIFNPNKSNILYVSAAGNDDQGITPDKDYPGVAPASCNGFIAAGSVTTSYKKTSDSNYGKTVFASLDSARVTKVTVDRSMCKTNACTISGTSIATAMLTSQLATEMINKPTLNKTQIINTLVKLPTTQKSLAKKTTPIPSIAPLRLPTPHKNIGGAEIITKERTVEKIVKETTTQVIVVTPTPQRSSTVTNTPAPTSKLVVTNTPTPVQPTKTPTSAPTSTPQPVPTATPMPNPTATPQPTPTEVLVCRDECIDYRDECPAGTVDVGACPINSRFKLCACAR